MNVNDCLLLFVPYTVFLVWGLGKYKLGSVFGVIVGVFTILLVWLVLVFIVNQDYLMLDAKDAFASVEKIRDGIDEKWKILYLSENLGYMIGLVYFFLCWLISLFFTAKSTLNDKE